jgi:hypothetical protein
LSGALHEFLSCFAASSETGADIKNVAKGLIPSGPEPLL